MALRLPERLRGVALADALFYASIQQSLAEFMPWIANSGMPFFPEFTDHGPDHVQGVLNSIEELIAEAWAVITPADVAVATLSVLLHDCAMHLTDDSFITLVTTDEYRPLPTFDDRPWVLLWQDFLAEAKRFSGRRLTALFGNAEPIHEPVLDGDRLTGRDRKLIGEFLRRHHPRLAHEIARGVPGPEDKRLRLVGLADALSDLAGLIARSHGLPLRACLPHLSELFDIRSYRGVHAVFLMALLRVSDYVQIQPQRAAPQRRLVIRLRSPISRTEWAVHESIKNITLANDDPEAICIQSLPRDIQTFLRLCEWLNGVQSELDSSWAVLGEVYERFKKEGLHQLGLTLRRVTSDLDDSARMDKRLPYVPLRISLESAGPDLLHLLVGPLYGERPEVGVRELIQNAVDAVRELNELKRQRGHAKATESESVDVQVTIAQEAGDWWLTVTDTGVGMTVETIQKYFLRAGASLRVSESWKGTFENEQGRSKVLRSGRFGIGVLAAFLLGERIEVVTRHIDQQGHGFSFLVTLDDEVIEVRKVSCESGTTIRVRLRHDTSDKLSSDYRSWDWFALTTPRVRRFADGQELRQEYQLPPMNAKLPPAWRRLHDDDFEDIQWTFSAVPALTCNGIVVKPRIRDFVNVRFSTVILDNNEEMALGNRSWEPRLAVPNLSVFDFDGKLPLNLQRTELQVAGYPFSAELADDVAKDFLAFALLHAPTGCMTKPRLYGRYWTTIYPGIKRGFLDHQLAPWFSTADGVTFSDLSLIAESSFSSALVLPTYSEAFAGYDLSTIRTSEARFTTLLVTQRGTRKPVVSSLDVFEPPEPFNVQGRRILVTRAMQPNVTFLQDGKFKVEEQCESWVLYTSGACPPPIFEFAKFAGAMQATSDSGWPGIAVEWYPNSIQPAWARSRVAKLWKAIFGRPTIPFRRRDRHAMSRAAEY